MAKKKKEEQVADLSQDRGIPEDINPPSAFVGLPEATITPPSPFEEPTQTPTQSYDVVCPKCGTQFIIHILVVDRPLTLANVECGNVTCKQVFNWDEVEKKGIILNEAVISEALEGIDKALEQKVEPEVFETVFPQNYEVPKLKLGTVIMTTHDRGIVVSYMKFVKYMYGIINLPNPQLANAFISHAGKAKLFQLLNITDRAEQDKIWAEFKFMYNNRGSQRV